MIQKVNIVLFGIGKAGSALINKALKNHKTLILASHIDLRFPVITNSTVAFFEKEGTHFSWEANFIQFGIPFKLEDVVDYVQLHKLDNLIAIDATASPDFTAQYTGLIRSGFSIVSINDALAFADLDFESEVLRTALNCGVDYNFIKLPQDNKAAADVLFDAILDIAQKLKAVSLTIIIAG